MVTNEALTIDLSKQVYIYIYITVSSSLLGFPPPNSVIAENNYDCGLMLSHGRFHLILCIRSEKAPQSTLHVVLGV